MAIIRMRDHLYDEIVNYAKEHLPEEACGLLAGVETGEGREIRKVYFLENKDHAEDHFTLDPRDQINAIRDMRANGLKPLGNWHSHPSSPSRPSVEDIRLAFDSKARRISSTDGRDGDDGWECQFPSGFRPLARISLIAFI